MKDESNFIANLKDENSRDKAFEILLDKYKKPIYWHIRKIVLDHDDSHDVLQNTFIKVFRGIKNFKENSKLYTWIYRIATNESLNFIKIKAKKHFKTSEEMIKCQTEKLKEDPYFDGNELQLELQKIVNSLPTKQKLVFQMKYEQEMKFKDIADILETSEGALKASYHIAVKKIKKEIIKKSNLLT